MDFLWVLFRLFTMALSMHWAACAAASAGSAGAAADMLSGLLVKNQPVYDQSNYDQKYRCNDDRSDICLYPDQHDVSAPFFLILSPVKKRNSLKMCSFAFRPVSFMSSGYVMRTF